MASSPSWSDIIQQTSLVLHALPLKRKADPLDERTVSQTPSRTFSRTPSRTPSRGSSPVNVHLPQSDMKPTPIVSDKCLSSLGRLSRVGSRTFDHRASIVFIGARGCGKSSLAVIAGNVLGRRVVDADKCFLKLAGISRSTFRMTHGLARYRWQELEVMRSMLVNHDQDCVIACGPGAVEDTGRALLEKYAESHLVIYVCRELESIQSYLGVEERDKKEKLIQDLHFMFRQSSNLEYFNLSEQSVNSSNPSIVDGLEEILPNRTFRRKCPQTLQNTKADLIKFLRLALGESSRLTDGVFHTLFPPNPEERIHTNALTCPLSALESISVNLDVLQDGIDVVELVVDMPANIEGYRNLLARDTICRALATVRRQFAVPVIYHVRLYDLSRPTLRRYFDLLHLGLRFAPDYITVDLRGPYEEIRRIVDVKGCTKVVGHLVDTDPGPDQWLSPVPMSRYTSAKELGCEVVRLCQPALSVEDNFSCHTFLKKINSLPDRIPTVAYNIGDRGYLSAAFNQVLTPVSHECLLDGSFTEKKPFTSLLSTFSARQIRQTQYTCRALDKLDYYVFGTNVHDSLSPSMHNAGFEVSGTPHTYSIFQSATLDEIRSLINAHNFGGASISMPFKTEIVSLLESLSPSARIIRAANTLLPIRRLDGADVPLEPRCKLQRNRAGRIVGFYGDNTDWMAVHACVLRFISPANAISPRSIGLVIGAGGMARAAIYALAWLGVRRIFLFNRTVSNAETLADYYNNITIDISGAQNNLDTTGETPTGTRLHVSVLESLDSPFPRDCSYPSVIVNTVPLHPIGDLPPPDFRIPSLWLQNPTGGVFVELSYRDSDTPLLQQIRAERDHGWVGVDPLMVLFEQGCAQFELFTGIKAPRRAMWESLLRKYADGVLLQGKTCIINEGLKE